MWRSSTKPFPVNQKSLLPCFALIILCQKANLVKPRSLLKESKSWLRYYETSFAFSRDFAGKRWKNVEIVTSIINTFVISLTPFRQRTMSVYVKKKCS